MEKEQLFFIGIKQYFEKIKILVIVGEEIYEIST